MMQYQLRNGLAALLLLSSVGIAAAAGPSASASDTLKLTSAQEHSIWQSVSKSDHGSTVGMKAPSGFTPSVGATVPSSLALKPLPSDIVSQVPAVKPYQYAMFNNELLIVNPTDKKVVDIIKG
jgi:hypothetical protein